MVTRRAAKAAAKAAGTVGEADTAVPAGAEFAERVNDSQIQEETPPAVAEIRNTALAQSLFDAVAFARGAIDGLPSAASGAVEDNHVGAHAEARMEAEGLAVHEFECTHPAYPQWRWTVVLAQVDVDSEPTICDVVLLPSSGALTPPTWVPWHERLQPGDLRPGDVVPTDDDDPRLLPGYTGEGDSEGADGAAIEAVVWELGLGRERVLSPFGRDDAAERWHDGATGPAAPEARQAPLNCSTCGFMVPIGGKLGQAFAICANFISPADGKVVSLAYGCGAHSQIAAAKAKAPKGSAATVDTLDYEDIDLLAE